MEYKVVYAMESSQWEVHWEDQKIGYKPWDQRVALSYAKDVAKKNRPSTILVYDREGKAKKQIDYPEKGKAVEKNLDSA